MDKREKGKRWWLTRRALLGTGWGAFLVSIFGPAIASVRFLFPNVVYEPPTLFKLGSPKDYPPDSVAFVEEQRLFIFNEPEGIRAMSAICTHLRCTTGPFEPPDGHYGVLHSHCPCHGSVFDRAGKVLQGPAPRPLECYMVTMAPDGRLLVNTNRVVGPDYHLKV